MVELAIALHSKAQDTDADTDAGLYHLLQLLLLNVAVLFHNAVELLSLQASHICLGRHTSSLLCCPSLCQVPIGSRHPLTRSLLFLPPLTFIRFSVSVKQSVLSVQGGDDVNLSVFRACSAQHTAKGSTAGE